MRIDVKKHNNGINDIQRFVYRIGNYSLKKGIILTKTCSPFGSTLDLLFMRKALEQAKEALQENEVPIGAVVVNADGKIIGCGHNRVEQEHAQVAHAEVIAIQQACASINDWRLNGCWLYVTLEPCAMCMGLVKLSRLEGIVFGARSPLFGYQLDNGCSFQVYHDGIVKIVEGVCDDEASSLLKKFFQARRKKSG